MRSVSDHSSDPPRVPSAASPLRNLDRARNIRLVALLLILVGCASIVIGRLGAWSSANPAPGLTFVGCGLPFVGVGGGILGRFARGTTGVDFGVILFGIGSALGAVILVSAVPVITSGSCTMG
jgi:hypothetical protein